MSKKPVYKHLEHTEQILLRPSMYIGSPADIEKEFYGCELIDGKPIISVRKDNINCGLHRIFIEILSNAIDNVWRSKDTKTPSKKIQITISDKDEITVWNDGQTIPIEINKSTGLYNPDMLFGKLLTGSNYDDSEERKTSGTNGLGATLCNIFSKKFRIETFDPPTGHKYVQEWADNMSVRGKPKITNPNLKNGYTEITFLPDYERFGVEGLSDSMKELILKNIVDTAMITGINIVYNDKKIAIKNLKEYAECYGTDIKNSIYIETEDSQVVLAENPNQDNEPISFVNGICTYEGGSHVEAWTEALLRPILEKINKSIKGTKLLTMKDVRKYFRLFLNCDLVNPSFTNQEKTKLVKPKVTVEVLDKHIKAIMKWDVLDEIKRIIEIKDLATLKNVENKKTYKKVEGLQKANLAGTKESKNCSLILCEGLSAATFAVSGIDTGVYGFKGRDYMGILPLRGKCVSWDTKIPLFSGSYKKACDISIGDEVIGDDGTPQKISWITQGEDEMFKISTTFGLDYIVNSQHTLSLRRTGDVSLPWDTEIMDIDIDLYSRLDNNSKSNLVSYRGAPVQWEKQITSIDPYLAGENMLKNKHIPKKYIINDINSRLRYLSGVLDMSGRIGRDIMGSYWSVTIQYDSLIRDFSYLVRSAGLVVEIKGSNVIIRGKLSSIPTKLLGIDSNTDYPISVEYAGRGKYVGFEVGGNHRFCLEDFQVTHNCLNVRGKTGEKISQNKEIGNIIRALNLRMDVDYTVDKNFKTLYYGRIILLSDADVDGAHITGLVLNIFHYLFPTLMERDEPFITSMRTPIIRVYPSVKTKKVLEFYTQRDFENYHKTNKGGEIKYFKGLGTNKKEEARDIFGKKMIEFYKDEDADDTIDKVFCDKNADLRKEWLEEFDPENTREVVSADQYQKLPISEFLDFEMILYSIDSCVRCLPNIMDGLKNSQRKVYFTVDTENIKKKTMKVAQLASAVAKITAYHHGENCLLDTIIKMAQSFVGANNIPYLVEDGQFGSRLALGDDAASGRYIFTKMSEISQLIYKADDSGLLTQIVEEDQKIEPEYYVPIVPMILINGCEAIGTGYSTKIPLYNPQDIINCVKLWIQNKGWEHTQDEDSMFPDLIPWYKGFLGTIEKVGPNKFISKGVYKKKGKIITVSEIPVNMSILKFNEHLEDLLEKKIIKSYKNYSSEVIIKFEIEEGPDFDIDILKLTSSILTSNMVLFNHKRIIKKYENTDEILYEFCEVRYDYYIKRKLLKLSQLEKQLLILKNKIKFLKAVISGTLQIGNVDEDKLKNTMIQMEFDIQDGKYDYLLNMNIRSFTKQRMDELQKDHDDLTKEHQILTKTKPEEIWLKELSELEKKL